MGTNASSNEEESSEESAETGLTDGLVTSSRESPEPLDDSSALAVSDMVVRMGLAAKALRYISVPRNFHLCATINSLGPICEGRLAELMRGALGANPRSALEHLEEHGWIQIGKGLSAWPSRELVATGPLKALMSILGSHLTEKFVQEQWGSQGQQQS